MRQTAFATFFLWGLASLSPQVGDASSLTCNSTSFCESTLRPGSQCIEGLCSNAFYHGGCLKSLLPHWNKTRVCNSDDPSDAEAMGYCHSSPFDYKEVRFSAKDWESANFVSWALQILLSEVLEVPTSVESGSPEVRMNFYDKDSAFEYWKTVPDAGLPEIDVAAQVQDCTKVTHDPDNYKPCFHVAPEIWPDDLPGGYKPPGAEPPVELGAMGENSIMIPLFAAEMEPSLVSFVGLKGQKNRRKIAELFKRPTRWGQYCEEFSPAQCSEPDLLAQRAPSDDEEANSFFVEGVYNGFFRHTEESDCDKYPTNCTGHFVDYPCGWTSYAQQQSYHLDMAFAFEGPESNGGYSYGEAVQIWQAALATKSPVIMTWWTPEPFYEQFIGTAAEFTRVLFPPPTQECQDNRIDFRIACAADSTLEQRMGDPLGVCDTFPQNLKKVLSTALYEISYSLGLAEDEAFQSPAYDAVRSFKMDNLQLDRIFKYWDAGNSDKWGFDPRDAVCQWAVENMELLQDFVPESHPRVVQDVDSSNQGLFDAAFALGIIAAVLTTVSIAVVFLKRKSKAIYHTQTEVLYPFLVGLVLNSIAAVFVVLDPSDVTCGVSTWLYNMGYAIHYVPLLLKMSAIQRLASSGKQMQRVRIKVLELFVVLALVVIAVIGLLVAWTIADPPLEKYTYSLTDLVTAEGHTVVGLEDLCGSDSDIWQYVSFAWRALLIIPGCMVAALALQVREDMNDTKLVAAVLFIHLAFLVAWIATFPAFENTSQSNYAGSQSVILSLDAIVATFAYVVPKFLDSGENMDKEILPDVFVHTTIALMDVTGFTEWTSVREPVAVFQFLEQLYSNFDELAERHKVYKVETVGECYVAATGVPAPQTDHVVLMARFAADCMRKMPRYLRKMEIQFGPGTASLSLRIGIHSGPVTGGFLRGKGSRFQLFGDSMTTANLIQSHGMAGRIHLSEDTANLLQKAGKRRWVTEREEKIQTMEKGELQTFWLIKGNSGAHDSNDTSNYAASSAGDSDSEDLDVELSNQERWVDYNTEVFKGLLQQIVARRAGLRNSSSDFATKAVGERDASMPLEEVKEIIELPKFDKKAVRRQRENQDVEVPPLALKQLREYVSEVADLYNNDNPFHNFAHASNVVMAVNKYMNRIIAATEINLGDNEERYRSSVQAALHDHTYGITSDPLTLFAAAFSALIHDVDHPGVPNPQLIKENQAASTKYKGRSVAEQKSLDIAMDLLNQDRFNALRTAICKNSEEMRRFRQLVVNSVMATDLGDKQLKDLRNGRWSKAFFNNSADTSTTGVSEHSSTNTGSSSGELHESTALSQKREALNRKATIVIEHLIQAADVAHMSQHWLIYRKWNARLFRETYLAYREGRAEQNPADNWYKGEIGFFDFYIIPLSKKLRDCGVFGPTSDENLNYATNNRNMWVKEGEAITKSMLKEVEEEYAKGLLGRKYTIMGTHTANHHNAGAVEETAPVRAPAAEYERTLPC